ncbi:MAG: type II 3-dehydroquinate dehydratase [bacterium]|nr:type II 3-dehydroquinate dehydratase [bacterium]
MTARVHILNGPNLSRLGRREPQVYGTTTLTELAGLCAGWAAALDLELTFDQCEGEGELVSWIHRAGDQADGLILNAGAYTHTSVAVRDAVISISIPVIEIHLSNPAAREPFRRQNLLEDVVDAGIRGFGIDSYRLALEGLAARLRS